MDRVLRHPVATLLLAALFISTTQGGESTSVRWRTFNEGLADAKRLDKKILVDIYTDWCGWCKKMDKEVYGNSRISQYLSKRFVVVKMNAESAAAVTYRNQTLTQRELSQAFGITGYPATLFMKANGDAITLLPGYVPAEQFLDILTFIGEDHYLTMKWEEYRGKK